MLKLAHPFATLIEAFGHVAGFRRRRALEQKLFDVFAGSLNRRPAVNAFGAVIPENNLPVQVAHDNRVVCFVQQGGLLADFFLGSLQFAHVNFDAHQPQRLPLRIIDDRGPVKDVGIRTVGPANTVFAPPNPPATGQHVAAMPRTTLGPCRPDG